jgi:DNA-binding FadR family transcriptional regulator
MRALFETENARLAARNRTPENLSELRQTVRKELEAVDKGIDLLTELDFQFHLLLALSTGNMSYPLLLNSFKPVYTNLTGEFFKTSSVVGKVHGFHADLVNAIEGGDEKGAVDVMTRLLGHGETVLREFISGKEETHGHGKSRNRS